mmetsp:Transcript_41531/g.61244  ORF Transcript_41531/g.61244 Transcript_41531/m.61244 type:complete len:152 (-) Transcript_41531:47-502(-)
MVRIINGEIVQDDDPRLRQRHTQTGSAQGRRSNMRTLFDQSSSQGPAGGGRTPPTPQGAGPNTRGGPPHVAVQHHAGDPFQMLAHRLGLAGKYLTVPAMFGMSETQVDLIHVIFAALLVLLLGLRAVVFVVVVYGIMKHSKSQQQQAQQQR